jgi:hypothetical protein
MRSRESKHRGSTAMFAFAEARAQSAGRYNQVMRTALLSVLLLAGGVALAEDDAAPRHALVEQWRAGFVYTSTEVESASSSIDFRLPQRDGSEMLVRGGVTDKHERSIQRRPVAFDDAGATRIEVSVLSHKLERAELPPGEASAKLTHNGPGPLTGAQWREEWRGDHWRHILTREAVSVFGPRPDELRILMHQRRSTRQQFMLPGEEVAVGERWKPSVEQLPESWRIFARDKDNPTTEIECRLESVTDGIATVRMEFKLSGTQPAKAATATEWSEDTKFSITGTATLTLHLELGYVQRYHVETTTTLNGRMWNSGSWLDATATLTTNSTTTTGIARQE